MNISAVGGTLFFLVVLHVIGDWILQWDSMARTKALNPKVRALHCTIYCLPFIPFLYSMPFWLAYLWITHFIIDSYLPLYHYRRLTKDPDAQTIAQFAAAFDTPRGMVIYVAYDQIFHLLTMIPIALALVPTRI